MKNGEILSDKYVLIVDDNELSRQILANIVEREYKVLEASNGREAIELMNQYVTDILAIMLDLEMPVMNGYEFLKEIRTTPILEKVPVIVITISDDEESEQRAFSLGARDFVTKPFNTAIIHFRLRNVIEHSKENLLYQLQYLSDFDQLTGIYSKSKFFKEMRIILKEGSKEKMALIRIDINRYHLVHDLFGLKEGNKLFCYIADGIRNIARKYPKIIFGKIESNTFGICMPFDVDKIQEFILECKEVFMTNADLYAVIPSVGIYPIEDNTMSEEEIYDRAGFAALCGKKPEDVQACLFKQEQYEKVINSRKKLIDIRQANNWKNLYIAIEDTLDIELRIGKEMPQPEAEKIHEAVKEIVEAADIEVQITHIQ